MASLSELMKNGGNTVGASGSAATSGRSLSQLMGIPTRSEREGLGELSISKLNENRQRMVQQRINAAKQAEWEEKQRQQALRARYVGQDSLVGQMQKDRAAAAVASANAQVTLTKSPGLDDNSLAYQMLRDRAASEQKQQTLPFEERIHNALNSSGDLASVYQKFPEITGSFTGTPAQDALNDYLMRRTDYSTYQTAPDFEKYSEMGDALKSPSFDRKTLHTFMTENEKKTYSYLLAKEGEQSAQRYLDSITETLNRRYGEKIAADVEGVRGTYLHPIVTAGVAAQSGLDRFTGGVAQAFSKYERPTSVMQYAGQAVREDQGTVGKFAYDAVNTLSNMAPSILASFLTAGLGAPAAVASFAAAGTLGLGSGGNAYKQALEEGHSKEEAQTVAILTGASEAVLSKLLSGISAFGGVSAEKLLPKVAAIENAAWRVLGAAGVKLGGEIAEEELQNFLEPLFKTIVYGDEYDVPTIGELAYTAFLTALTTGVLEGGEIAQYRTKEGAASAAQTEVQRTAQGSAESVSEQSSIPGGGQAKNAPVASQTEQRAVSTGLRDPMQVLLEENRKAQAQKNENPAAEMQQDVKKVSTVAKAPGFYKNDRFGGTDEDAAYLDRLAKAAGISIEMAEAKNGSNGWIVNGKAYISEETADPLRVVAKHEVTHHLQDAAGEAYTQFRDYVEQIYRGRGTLDQQISAIQTLYRRNGQELSREAALDELAADYAGELLENETLIRKLAGERRSLGQKILDAIRNLLSRVRTAFSSAEVKQLDRAARLWENALRETNAAYQRGEVAANPATRYSMAGVNAKTADLDALSRAEEMERRGVDEETIFRDTGWIRGADQKWRFEIDDSGMKYHRHGDALLMQDPGWQRLEELTERYDSLTEKEIAEYAQLEKQYSDQAWDFEEKYELRDFISHKALFEAYPYLNHVGLVFVDDLPVGTRGFFNKRSNTIVLNESIRNAPASTLLHEIQHAIQQVEGFSGGSSPEYFNDNGYQAIKAVYREEIDLLQKEVEKWDRKFSDEWGEDSINLELAKKYIDILESDDGDWNVLSEIDEAAESAGWDDLLDGYTTAVVTLNMKKAEALLNRRDNVTAYLNTAGEIEARETARRRKMTAEQRRESIPFRGDENTVFADGAGTSFEYVGETKDGRRVYQTNFGKEVSNAEKIEQFRERIATVFNLGAVTLRTDIKKIKVNGDRFTAQKNLYGDLTKGKDTTEFMAKVNALYDMADILENSTFEGPAEPEESYITDQPPKNAAHKGVKYWYKFKNSIVMDGVGYKVTFNIRDKGNDGQYAYLVEFKEDGTSGASNTAVNGLLRSTQMSHKARIPRERQSVKGSRDLQKQIDALERQNKRLKEQMKRTDVPKVRREVVKRSAKDLRSMYSSRIDLDVLTDRIENVYNQLAKLSGAGNLQELDGIPSWDEVRSEMRSIADAILAESRGNVNPMTEEYGEIRKELRGRKISIADEYRADLESAGGYEGIRKQNFGTFSLSKDGTPIDTVYEELNEKYPTLFPDDIVHPADQLIRLSDVMEDLKAVEGNPFESNLDTTAQYLAGEIEERFYDTPNQKPTLADKMENTYHRQRIKDQKELRAKLSGQKRAYEQQVNEIHERYAAENRQRIENQNAAQRRETIYRHAKRLATKLLRPTNKQHVPEELRGAAYNLIRYINLESGYELSYGKGADYRRVPKGSELDAEPNSRTLAAIALKDKLEKMAGKENMTVVIDPDMSDYLDKIALMGDKTLQQMTRAELDTVWKVMQIVEHTINRANELHEQGRYENLSAMARAVDETNKGRRQRTDYVKIVGAVDKFLNFDMLSPETFFHKLGKPGDEIYRMMRKAADRQTEIYNEGVSKAQKLVEESGADFSKLDKKLYDFDFGERGKITLSKSQIMELYALSRRDQAKEHIIQGGLKAVGAAKGIVDQSNVQPVKVTWEEVGQITSKLTDKEKKLVEGLQAYLSNELAGHGNKETLKVYGYGKFKERFYWPIKVSGTETNSDPGKAAHAKTIPGYGMTKNTEPDANNAVELHSAIDTFSNHLNQMATYAAWLGTNEDITRLINYRFDNSDNTMKRILATVYGKNGEKYINDLLSDIAQGTKAGQDRTLSESMLSQWKAAKVGGNLRVVVQQPTAILRAMTMLDPKYMVASANVKTGWEKAKKYAPIAQWKDWGYFEIGTGRSLRELIVGTESGVEKIKNLFMWAAGEADSVSWGYLWNAVERETADKHPELTKGSEEFYQTVADRFSEIIDRTQVVDSVLHRTQVMRSGNALNKMATSFMSEPSKVYNMVARDLYDIAAADGQAARNRAYKALGKSSAALITSFAVNALMQSFVDALRDDDRDKDYWEKFAENYFGITGEEESFKEYHDNFWSGNFWQNFNPLSYVPYIKDALSIAQGYEVDRTDMAAISDLATALQQFFKSISGEGKKTTLATGIDAVAKIGDLIGIPVSNLKRDAESIFDTMLNEFELYNVQYEMDKIVYNDKNSFGVFANDLYRTMNNDYDTYEEIYEDMYEGLIERGYEKDKAAEKISDAIEDRMKKELGVQSVKSLPVRYSPPTTEDDEDPFYALLKKAKEADTGWVEQLDPGSIEIALAVDEVRDTDTLEKIKTVAAQPYGEDLKRLAMRNFMGDSQWYRYLGAHNAGVTTMEYAEFLEKLAAEAKRRTGKEDATTSQADVLAVLKKSKLTAKQKRAIWNGYGWKANSPW